MDDQQRPALRLKLLLEVDRRDPLCGRIGPAEGPLRPFAGWIGLAGAISDCLGSDEPAPAEPDGAGASVLEDRIR